MADLLAEEEATGMTIRPLLEPDLAAALGIYSHYVVHGLGTFEEVAPTLEEFRRRWEEIMRAGLPYLAAEVDGQVVGYAYAGRYRPRSAYRYTVEDSIYVEAGFQGHGIGRALLAELLRQLESGPWTQVVAVIGDSGNMASIRLHERFGFRHAGMLKGVGFKLERWVDTVLMQRALPPGDG